MGRVIIKVGSNFYCKDLHSSLCLCFHNSYSLESLFSAFYCCFLLFLSSRLKTCCNPFFLFFRVLTLNFLLKLMKNCSTTRKSSSTMETSGKQRLLPTYKLITYIDRHHTHTCRCTNVQYTQTIFCAPHTF